MKSNNTIIDLFSGCGGMSWGLSKFGFHSVAAVDNWDVALETYAINHKQAKIYSGDIRELDPKKILSEIGYKVGDIDCIVGGPPCQGFSKNVPAKNRFIEDPRNQLFKEYIRFVEIVRPKVVVMENVAEIYGAFDGAIREQIIELLSKLGYEVRAQVLHAPDYGIPQRRRRCFFIASRTGKVPVFPAPTHDRKNRSSLILKPFVSAWEAISDLPSLQHSQGNFESVYDQEPHNDYQAKMRETSQKLYNHIANKMSPKQYRRICSLQPGQAIADLPENLRPRSGYSGAYGRLDYKMISPTITRWVFHFGSGRYGHPRDNRTLTMREAARIQSFSDDFIFSGSNTDIAGQIGNAVPPGLMSALAPEIIRLLS